MPIATRYFHNRIAIIFDFDDTLAPDSFQSLLNSWQLQEDRFRSEQIQPLLDAGWESILARFHTLIQTARQHEELHLSQKHLAQVGQQMELFAGVPEMFDRVRSAARAIAKDVEVEFYMLTSGFAEIPRASAIAGEFVSIWGGEFAFDENGEAIFAKQIITHPEKVRYILQLAKGLGTDGANAPADVYQSIPDEEWHVPLDQIVYIGDGASDMPVFGLLHDHGGMAIGIYKGDNVDGWRGYSDTNVGRRIANLASASYAEDSELLRSIILAVESISKRLALLQLSQDE